LDLRTFNARLDLWRTQRVLTRAPLDMARASRVVGALSDDALRVAADNPDHSPAGRAAALDALKARGVADLQPPPLAAPSFVQEADAERIVPHGSPGPERWLRVIGAIVFAGAIVGWMAFAGRLDQLRDAAIDRAYHVGVLTAQEYAQRDVLQPNASQVWAERYIEEPRLDRFASDYHALTGALALSLMGGIALWVMGGMFKSRPARILLLRKFNNAEVDHRLRRFVKRNLSPLGHVFTLSDRHFRRPWLSLQALFANGSPTFWTPIVILAPWDLVRGRFNGSSAGGRMRVWSAKDFRRFAQRVTERVACNTQVMATGRRTVMVRTSDAWWRHVVRLLMLSADAIVVDLSDVTEGTEWELDRLVELGLLDRTVFVVRQDAEGALAVAAERFELWRRHGVLDLVVWKGLKRGAEEARRAVDRMGVEPGEIVPLRFRNNGTAVERVDLRERLKAALRAGLRAKSEDKVALQPRQSPQQASP
jgi:hypothetical protein